MWDGEETQYVHRLSWIVENGEISAGTEVCHTCDNPLCNNIKHLFVGTHTDNMRDMAAKGRIGAYTHPEKVARGERSGCVKLTEADVLAIRRIYASGSKTQRPLAAQFKVSQGTIWQVVSRTTWTHI